MAEIITVRLLVPDDQFFSQTGLGTIGGTIYFQIGADQFFPEKGWTDLPLAVLGGWLEALVEIADGTVSETSAPFLDGDLEARVSRGQLGFVHLDFFLKGKTRLSTTTRIHDLLENALTAADSLLTRCRQKNWSNNDTEALAALADQGARILSTLPVPRDHKQ